MSVNRDSTSALFLDKKKRLDEELRSLAEHIQEISEDDFSDVTYRNFSQRMDYIQNLFDDLSVVAKDLSLEQSNPDLYELLQAKAELNNKYGAFHRLRSSLYNRFTKHKAESLDEPVLYRGEPSAEEAEPEEVSDVEEEALEEELSEEELLEMEALMQEEAEAAEEEALAKKAEREQRQKDLAKKAQTQQAKREAELQERTAKERDEAARREQAQRLDAAQNNKTDYSEADLRNERLRQDDARIAAEEAQRSRIQANRDALEAYNKKIYESLTFDRLAKSHIDLSYDNGYTPSEYVPGGYKTESFSERPQLQVENNAKLYSALNTNRTEDQALTVSSVYETQMRFNVENARLRYAEARGTSAQAEAAHEYIEQRRALMSFQDDIRAGRINIAGSPVEPLVVQSKEYSNYEKDIVYSYTPSGITARTIQDGKLTDNVAQFENPGLRSNHTFNPANPLRVTPEYEATLLKQVQQAADPLSKPLFNNPADFIYSAADLRKDFAHSRLNNLASSTSSEGVSGRTIQGFKKPEVIGHFEGPGYNSHQILRASNEFKSLSGARAGTNKDSIKNSFYVTPAAAASFKFYSDAYLGFQKAKKDGSVIVTPDAKGTKMPDFNVWQQRQQASRAFGTTVQSKTINPNNVTKAQVEESVASIFSSSSKLKRDSLANAYFRQAGYRLSDYGTRAVYSFSRKFYNMMQEGEDNALRTLETGRYYAFTATGVVLAIHDKKAAQQRLTGPLYDKNLEFKRYGNTSLLSNSQLSRNVNNGVRLSRERMAQVQALRSELVELNRQISALNEKGILSKSSAALLKKYESKRDSLSAKIADLNSQNASANWALRKEVSLKNLRFRERIHNELLKELNLGGKPPKNLKQLDRMIEDFRDLANADIQKKFGSLTKMSAKSLVEETDRLKNQAIELKNQIKLLQTKGSSLSQVERKLLAKLMKQHKELNDKLKPLIGLKNSRDVLDMKLKELGNYRKKFSLSYHRFHAAIFALQGFMLRPFQESGEYGLQGMAKMIRYSSNHYVHVLLKKGFKLTYRTSLFAGKMVAETVSPGSSTLISASVNMAKTTVNAQVQLGQKAIKTAVESGVKNVTQGVARGINHITPSKIKTAVKGSVAKGAALKSKYDTVATGIHNAIFKAKQWYADTALGRGFAATSRFAADLSQGIKTFLSAAKSFSLKAIAIFLVVCLVFQIISAGAASLFGGSSSTMILSPYAKDEKIDLGPYVDIIQAKQQNFDNKIDSYKLSDAYDNVYVEYVNGIERNGREMLSMMAVRMSQDLDLEKNPDVKVYLEYLFDKSHSISTQIREYQCSGCETTIEYCKPGCKYRMEYCEGEEIRTCTHKSIFGYCLGHKVYYCDGHEKLTCPGHKDLTVYVTVLGFDEIFGTDKFQYAGEAIAGELLGTFTITHYCCEKYHHICNAGPPYLTATMTVPTPDRTIAVDPKVIKLGTHVVINGQEYIAEDTGGAIKGNRIDICVETHAEALEKGRYQTEVYLATYEGEGIQETGEWEGWNDANVTWCKNIYEMDWSKLYDGIAELTNSVGTSTDLSGVEFIDGDRPGNQAIVDLALSQLGNHGGYKYWSWYGFGYRVPWCAIFVSWCANQQGVLDDAIPKFAGCVWGTDWFKSHGQWAKRGDITPVAGDVIFFDWDYDGRSDHVGFVVGCDESNVYTVEGNSSDSVATRSYALTSRDVMGYGIPNY